MKKTALKKYLTEGLLIVFSVLFALFINKIYDDYQVRKQKEIAQQSIQKELYRNIAIIKRWKSKHVAIRNTITAILEGKNDSLKDVLLTKNYLDFGLITENSSLIDANLIDTAWESAKTTGIISEFDFETAQSLTNAYGMQEELMSRTFPKIIDLYFDKNTHNMNDLEVVLRQFQLRFLEMTGQEFVVEDLYAKATQSLE